MPRSLSATSLKALEWGDLPLQHCPSRYISQYLVDFVIGRGLQDEDKSTVCNRESSSDNFLVTFTSRAHQRWEGFPFPKLLRPPQAKQIRVPPIQLLNISSSRPSRNPLPRQGGLARVAHGVAAEAERAGKTQSKTTRGGQLARERQVDFSDMVAAILLINQPDLSHLADPARART
jgi:hypothetical protein